MTIINDAEPTDADPIEGYLFGAMRKPIRERDLKVYFFAAVVCFPLSLLGVAALTLWLGFR